MQPEHQVPIMSVKVIIAEYLRADRRFQEALRVFDADWPVAVDLVARVQCALFASGVSAAEGYLAFSYALSRYSQRSGEGDQRRLILFMENYVRAVAVQVTQPASMTCMDGFKTHIDSVESEKPEECDLRRQQFDERFLRGNTSIARVWQRIKRQGLSHA